MSLELFAPLTKPTAAQFNALDAAITGLEEINDGVGRSYPTPQWSGSGSRWMFRRRYRWLTYDSSGSLEDPAGVADAVSLPDSAEPGVANILDLNSVDWLPVGRFYRVTGCQYAVERGTPPGG